MGSGRMAGAMVRGILDKGVYQAAEITCTSARDGTAEALANETGIQYSFDLGASLAPAEIVVLACKPQQLEELDPSLPPLTRGKPIISILAGTPISKLSEQFPEAGNIIRSMPNTPGQIGRGITAYAAKKALDESTKSSVEAILGALGDVVPTEESLLDAVTAVSGSGPAYVFEFIAALRDGGIEAGLDPNMAYQLALKTVQGAASLLEAVPEPPETHRNWVSSPGGTTLAGLAIMDEAGLRDIMKKTVIAARDRSRELARGE